MNFKITIIEDQPEAKEQLLTALDIWQQKIRTHIEIEYFCSGENYFSTHTTDESELYILDIQLRGMDGIKIAKQLRSREYQGNILFLTAFREYVFDGYNVRALNYLLKPVSQEALERCLDDVYSQYHGNYFLLRNGTEFMQIPYRDILCFSVTKHYVDITTTTQVYCTRFALRDILQILPQEFIQVHRAFIVNMRHIRKMVNSTIHLSNKTTVEIGRNFLEEVRQHYADFSMRLDVPYIHRK